MNSPLTATATTADCDAAPGAVFAEMEAEFSASGLADIDTNALRQWRPAPSLWTRIKPLLAAQVGAKLRWAEVDGHRLQYWDIGDSAKPCLVLLHGFGASKENWPYLAVRLRAHYRLLVPNLPGFGNSSAAR